MLSTLGIHAWCLERFLVSQSTRLRKITSDSANFLQFCESVAGTFETLQRIDELELEAGLIGEEIKGHESQLEDLSQSLKHLEPAMNFYNSTKICLSQWMLDIVNDALTKKERSANELVTASERAAELKAELQSIQLKLRELEAERQIKIAEDKDAREHWKHSSCEVEKMRTGHLGFLRKLKELEVLFNAKKEERDRVEQQQSKLGSERKTVANNICTWREESSSLDQNVEQIEAKIKTMVQNQRLTSSQLHALKIAQDLQKSVLALGYRDEQTSSELTNVGQILSDKNEEYNRVKAETDALPIQLDAHRKLLELRKSLESLQSDRAAWCQRQADLTKQQKPLNQQGCNKTKKRWAAVEQLKLETGGGVLGCLEDLGNVIEESYACCVQAAIGRVLELSVVVRNRSVAQRVVEFFKYRRLGPVSCDIVEELEQDHCSGRPNALQSLRSLIQSKEGAEVVWDKHCCNWFVVNTVDEASSVPPRSCNVVTVEGHVFAQSGELSVVTRRPNSNMKLSTFPNEQSLFADEMEQIKKELDDIDTRIKTLTLVIDTLRKESIDNKRVRSRAECRLKEMTKCIRASERRLAVLTQEKKRLTTDGSALESRLQLAKRKVDEHFGNDTIDTKAVLEASAQLQALSTEQQKVEMKIREAETAIPLIEETLQGCERHLRQLDGAMIKLGEKKKVLEEESENAALELAKAVEDLETEQVTQAAVSNEVSRLENELKHQLKRETTAKRVRMTCLQAKETAQQELVEAEGWLSLLEGLRCQDEPAQGGSLTLSPNQKLCLSLTASSLKILSHLTSTPLSWWTRTHLTLRMERLDWLKCVPP
eukprot:GHVN01053178.1.p1 GENE.GHVN01053178.1~~GHVN01053178.1.p1  ORF type:complete len:827 (-),score=136.75 GHVN01053178.1:102-2582(-)